MSAAVRLPAPRFPCPLDRAGRLELVPSGPSGYRLRCRLCRLVLVIPRAQLAAVARRLDPADRRRLGWSA